MTHETKQQISRSVQDFRLPRYDQIPTVGLYLEQACKYINEYLAPLGDAALTTSMISNYVKKGLIDSPQRKQYSREQIAYLFFIAVAKSIMSLDGLIRFIGLQKRTYPLDQAYDYFCQEFENILFFSFDIRDEMASDSDEFPDEKRLLYSCIVAVVQKVYLEKSLQAMEREQRTDPN